MAGGREQFCELEACSILGHQATSPALAVAPELTQVADRCGSPCMTGTRHIITHTHNDAHIGHDSHRELQTKLAMRLMAGIHNSVSWRPAPYSGASGCLTLSTPILLYQQDKPQIHNANEQQILVARPSPHALTQSLYMLLMPSNHITKPSMA